MTHYIITIAREYGSGGKLIGQQLAKELNIPFYDQELISLAAKKSDFAEDFIQKTEQKKDISFLYNLYMSSQELPLSEQIFLIQSKIIQELAEKESCVILGRCADYVLKDYENCLRIFIHAPIDDRMKRVKDDYKEEHAHLHSYIHKQDKHRASYYNYLTQNNWGEAQNYHLTINSSIGISATVHTIKACVQTFQRGEA